MRSHLQDLSARYGLVRLGIFGSAARDQMTDTSDIDVIVEMPPDLFQLIGLKQELEELLDRPVDIVRYRDQMNRFLKERIDREAIYV
ncbi:MAG: nucleotidyltransferase domain-containing protein [Caldilinea sp.]|nr:nucleotidyltransferase domain-containing protein [Caldilineaceae bacterium]MCB0069776.1 nucleotidyltransferase domain-containing protein [Caldilineaceae bacterium]MCO5212723.1 nucleotidyltransferase domain-containing protein [Caldilinea sp.]MCW5841665.1 nucleotidyltransferase domain-containing protein [Caldilinea sp.]